MVTPTRSPQASPLRGGSPPFLDDPASTNVVAVHYAGFGELTHILRRVDEKYIVILQNEIKGGSSFLPEDLFPRNTE